VCYHQRMRSAPLLAIALSAMGCGSGSPPLQASALDAPTIQASPATDGELAAARIDAEDPVARRCLDAALRAETDDSATPCSQQTPGACAARCRKGDLFACQQLAEALGDDEPTCADRLLTLACERGQPSSCVTLGLWRLDPERPEHDPGAGTALLRRACDAGHARGCGVLGRALAAAAGDGDASEALALLERACALGDSAGCADAAHHLKHGDGVPSDMKRAAELARKACGLGEPRGCIELASSLFMGQGVARDVAQARSVAEQVCALDDDDTGGEGCFLAATLASPGGTSSSPRAEAFFARACTKGHFDGCNMTASLHDKKGRYAQAVQVAANLIGDQPRHWRLRESRGLSLFDLGRHAEAAADLAVLVELRAEWSYGHLWLYVSRARAGQDGGPQLRSWLKARDATKWPTPVARMLLGEMGGTTLLRAARDADARKQLEHECEAYYYLAQRELIAGRTAQARRWLNKTVATNITDFIEYSGAVAELSRMPTK